MRTQKKSQKCRLRRERTHVRCPSILWEIQSLLNTRSKILRWHNDGRCRGVILILQGLTTAAIASPPFCTRARGPTNDTNLRWYWLKGHPFIRLWFTAHSSPLDLLSVVLPFGSIYQLYLLLSECTRQWIVPMLATYSWCSHQLQKYYNAKHCTVDCIDVSYTLMRFK